MARSTEERLAAYERRYRELAAQLADIGFISSGSLTRRYTRCSTPGCRCHADPPQPHGPYYQWTTKIDGKTITRRLTKAEAELYQDGSPTTAGYAPSSTRCETSQPEQPNSRSNKPQRHQPRFKRKWNPPSDALRASGRAGPPSAPKSPASVSVLPGVQLTPSSPLLPSTTFDRTERASEASERVRSKR